MKKLVAFIGEGGSGKTTLIAELVRRYPNRFKKVVTCTSRAIRVGERDGVDYHFFSIEYFIENQDLVLVRKTDDGDYYGTRKSDLLSNTHHLLITLRLVGVSKLISLGFENIIMVRISISEEFKIERMRHRSDTEEMIRDRLRLDAADRTEMADVNLGQIPTIDLDANQPLDEKVEQIFKAC